MNFWLQTLKSILGNFQGHIRKVQICTFCKNRRVYRQVDVVVVFRCSFSIRVQQVSKSPLSYFGLSLLFWEKIDFFKQIPTVKAVNLKNFVVFKKIVRRIKTVYVKWDQKPKRGKRINEKVC